mmetsp:Transcript_23225/g.65967  ORF Transcript_23225/g.65967 Transcript_23225/m.65967 type:complete len:81 (+) Transcript_23225:266-508(+)
MHPHFGLVVADHHRGHNIGDRMLRHSLLPMSANGLIRSGKGSRPLRRYSLAMREAMQSTGKRSVSRHTSSQPGWKALRAL